MTSKIETYYTGGGITLVETNLDEKHYLVVSSEAPEFLTTYSYSDNKETYLPEDMVDSKHENELSSDLKPLYYAMLDKLKSA
jgi:hypothetical protein